MFAVHSSESVSQEPYKPQALGESWKVSPCQYIQGRRLNQGRRLKSDDTGSAGLEMTHEEYPIFLGHVCTQKRATPFLLGHGG